MKPQQPPTAPAGPTDAGTGSVELYEANDGTLYFAPVGEGIAIVMPQDGAFLADCRLYRSAWDAPDFPDSCYPTEGAEEWCRDPWPQAEGIPDPVNLDPPGVQHVATYRGPGCTHNPDTLEIHGDPGICASEYLGLEVAS